MKPWRVGILTFGGLLLIIGYNLRIPITLHLMERAVTANLRTDLLDELPDGLHLLLCGAGSPLPDKVRSGPCSAVIAGQDLYIVDAGSGASRNLSLLRVPQRHIDAVLLTHYHSDHIDGLGELLLQRWVNGSSQSQTQVYGPTGVDQVVNGFNQAYQQDKHYRIAHHGEEILPPSGAGGLSRPFPEPEDGKVFVLVDDGNLKIVAFKVDHSPVEPAVGYRFDYKGRSIVISGDTSKSANLGHFSKGADLLVHEALAPQLVAVISTGALTADTKKFAKITEDILDYHSSPIDAAGVASDAQVGHLLFNHIIPPLPISTLEEVFLEGVDDVYSGPVTIGRDGTLVSLKAGSRSIEVTDLF